MRSGLPRWMAALLILSAVSPAGARATSDPPVPTELRLYGSVLAAGANLDPTAQPLMAIVNGRVCGTTTTFLNPDDEPVDGGLTVYVVSVAADGPRANEIEGCGGLGDPVTFYLPEAGRLLTGSVPFSSGWARLDLTLGSEPPLGRLLLPLVATDASR